MAIEDMKADMQDIQYEIYDIAEEIAWDGGIM
jgi:cob(I)alamin adenosyltransferase